MAPGPVLIIGAGGQLGTAFVRLLEGAFPVTRRELDLATASTEDIRTLFRRVRPSIVINCAAYTNVDQAETEEALATEINGHAVGRLAEASAEIGVPFVTYSTDYVFDGQGQSPYLESHPPDPINVYGRSKLVGEQAALTASTSAVVIRTSWVLSRTHRNFVTAILARASTGETLKVVDDQRGCPTIVDDLAVATMNAVGQDAVGLLHLTNRGGTTWYELARVAVERAGFDAALIHPCSTEEYPTPARRPPYSILGSEVTTRLGLDMLPNWEDSIGGVVAGSLSLIRSSA